MIDAAVVEKLLHELYIAVEGTRLRKEDRKKVVEVTAMLRDVGRVARGKLIVDAAAGKAYVGLLAGALAGAARVVVIERDSTRIEACRAGVERLGGDFSVEIRAGEVSDAALWPASPDVVVALHACGRASDQIIDRAIAAHARRLFLVPCCYALDVPFSLEAEALAEATGVPRHPELRRRYITTLIDTERTLRLEAAGYQTTAYAFVPPTVTPHNLCLRALRVAEPVRMREAAERLARIHSGIERLRSPVEK